MSRSYNSSSHWCLHGSVGQLCFLLFVLKLFSCEFFGSWLCLHFYAEDYIPVSQMYWDVIIPDADFFCFSKLSLWAVDNFQI
jgi:hypothetical protein